VPALTSGAGSRVGLGNAFTPGVFIGLIHTFSARVRIRLITTMTAGIGTGIGIGIRILIGRITTTTAGIGIGIGIGIRILIGLVHALPASVWIPVPFVSSAAMPRVWRLIVWMLRRLSVRFRPNRRRRRRCRRWRCLLLLRRFLFARFSVFAVIVPVLSA